VLTGRIKTKNRLKIYKNKRTIAGGKRKTKGKKRPDTIGFRTRANCPLWNNAFKKKDKERCAESKRPRRWWRGRSGLKRKRIRSGEYGFEAYPKIVT